MCCAYKKYQQDDEDRLFQEKVLTPGKKELLTYVKNNMIKKYKIGPVGVTELFKHILISLVLVDHRFNTLEQKLAYWQDLSESAEAMIHDYFKGELK